MPNISFISSLSSLMHVFSVHYKTASMLGGMCWPFCADELFGAHYNIPDGRVEFHA